MDFVSLSQVQLRKYCDVALGCQWMIGGSCYTLTLLHSLCPPQPPDVQPKLSLDEPELKQAATPINNFDIAWLEFICCISGIIWHAPDETHNWPRNWCLTHHPPNHHHHHPEQIGQLLILVIWKEQQMEQLAQAAILICQEANHQD